MCKELLDPWGLYVSFIIVISIKPIRYTSKAEYPRNQICAGTVKSCTFDFPPRENRQSMNACPGNVSPTIIQSCPSRWQKTRLSPEAKVRKMGDSACVHVSTAQMEWVEDSSSHTDLQWGCLTGRHSPQIPHLPDVPLKKLSSSEVTERN